MNILYINHYAGSLEMGMEFRPYYLAREWVKMGHKVRIVAATYSHLRKQNPSVKKDFEIQEVDGIEYQWVKTGEYEGNGFARAMTMIKFCGKLQINAIRIARDFRPDIVIGSSTYPLDAFPAYRIANISKAKYIHEVHDMWPATLYEVGGMSKSNPFVILMQIAENYAYSQCDRCVSLLPFAEKYMKAHGLAEGKFINIQNGIVKEDWEEYEQIPQEHQKLFEENKDKFIVGYFGGHALSNALDNALDVASEFIKRGDNNVLFVFVGDGVEKPRLISRVKDENLYNVKFLPSVKKKAIPDLLTYFDCSYMTGMDSPLYRFGLCLNKMYDSMMAGLPIICAFNAPDTLVKTTNCGYQCDPTHMESVVDAIVAISKMSEKERKEMGKKGRDVILREYKMNSLAERFIIGI